MSTNGINGLSIMVLTGPIETSICSVILNLEVRSDNPRGLKDCVGPVSISFRHLLRLAVLSRTPDRASEVEINHQ